MKKTSAKSSKISIVLPLYNEEENVELQYKNITDNLKNTKLTYEIIFVDDGSTDNSVMILKKIAKKDTRIKIIQFRRNFGQTAAMAAGINHSSGDIIIFMDSDLQNDAKDIPMLVDKINEGYDVVSGWRKDRKDKFFSRKLPSRIANRLIARVSGVRLHDLGCSLKAYRGEVLREVKLYGEMHRFIPIHASWVGARITEIPVTHHPRQFGTSKYGIKRTFKVLLDLITVKFMGSYSTKPIYIFGGFGFLLMVMGMFSFAGVIFMKFYNNLSMNRNPLLFLTVMLVIMSIIFIMLGILAEILIRIYHESQDKPPYKIREMTNLKNKK
ncbi:MAG TPA: glycosyltransferase family 2 protein [Spirochaetota bacterium]|nr:glycosyltransferase family 2 protein [Spirochaetota bacterium]HPJ36902.1 glycosyltransferase family 2 protein [Spirochaetota bacterium]